MPRPRLGTEALTNAQRQKRKRSRRAAETTTLRLLLREATRSLRLHAGRPYHDHQVCMLCGAFDEHTPQCLIYRAERALEELETSP
jgi:hypothetical protein